jgi:hypothetical protein
VLIILKLRVKITGEWGAARNSPLPDLPTTDAARTTCKTKQITKQTKTIQLFNYKKLMVQRENQE